MRLDYWSPQCWRSQTENRRVRRRQLEAVIEPAADIPPSMPLIVGGDFNAPAGDAVYRVLRATAAGRVRRGRRRVGQHDHQRLPLRTHRSDLDRSPLESRRGAGATKSIAFRPPDGDRRSADGSPPSEECHGAPPSKRRHSGCRRGSVTPATMCPRLRYSSMCGALRWACSAGLVRPLFDDRHDVGPGRRTERPSRGPSPGRIRCSRLRRGRSGRCGETPSETHRAIPSRTSISAMT